MAQLVHRYIPTAEFRIAFVRSGGPGGQNVNKISSKAQLHWHVQSSFAFSDEEKGLIHKHLAHRINNAGEVVLSSEQERSQLQNKQRVISQLHELIAKALRPVVKRIPTKPSRGTKARRLEEKTRHGQKKILRREIGAE